MKDASNPEKCAYCNRPWPSESEAIHWQKLPLCAIYWQELPLCKGCLRPKEELMASNLPPGGTDADIQVECQECGSPDCDRGILCQVMRTVRDRGEAYGCPADSWACVADVWSLFLWKAGVLPRDKYITSRQAAVMMVMLKAIRDANEPKEDNLVDIAGYAWVADQCQ